MKRIFIRSILGIFLFTACLVPAISKASETPAQKALDYLVSMQNTDGGLHEKDQNNSAALQTAWSIIGFSASEVDPASVSAESLSLVDYETAQACNYSQATDIERSVLALISAGNNLSDLNCNLRDKLSGLANHETGQIGDGLISTVFGIFAFKATGLEIPENSIEFVISEQKPNGGWDSGWGTESNITAQALNALAILDVEGSAVAILKAKNYLKSLQGEDGGIKYSADPWISAPDAFSDAYTLQAIYALGESPDDEFWTLEGNSIIEHLMKFQKKDGSFYFSFDPWGDGTPVWTTAIVLPSLNKKYYPVEPMDFEPIKPQPSAVPSVTATPVQTPQPIVTQTPEVIEASLSSESIKEVTAYSAIEASEEPKNSSKQKNEPISEPSSPPELTNDDNLNPTVLAEESSRSDNYSFFYLFAGLAVGLFLVFLGKRKGIFLVVSIVFSLSAAARAEAGEAGLLIRHSDGTQRQYCIKSDIFPLKSEDLFEISGVSYSYDRGFLVSLDGEKALSAWEEGAKDQYWSHWIDEGKGLTYANFGAQVKLIKEGAVDGWQIGSSKKTLKDVPIETICPKVTPSSTVRAQEASTTPKETPEAVIEQAEESVTSISIKPSDTPQPLANTATAPPEIKSPQPQVLGSTDEPSAAKSKPLYFIAGVLIPVLGILLLRVVRRRS